MVLLFGCADHRHFSGQVREGLTGEPRSGLRLSIEPEAERWFGCGTRRVVTDEDGRFVADGVCTDRNYALGLQASDALLFGRSTVVVGTDDVDLDELSVWPVPPVSEGVFLLRGDRFLRLEPLAEVRKERLEDSDQDVLYPSLKPVEVAGLGADDWLVIRGTALASRLEVQPLVQDTARRAFAGEVVIDQHVYVGARFLSAQRVERVSADVNAAHTARLPDADGSVRYISGAALSAGQYALFGKGDTQMYVVEVLPR